MTAFEPEALGNLVEGLDFHRFYFENREQFRLSGGPVVCSRLVSCRMAQQGDRQHPRGSSGASEEEDSVWTGVGTISIPSPNSGLLDCQLPTTPAPTWPRWGLGISAMSRLSCLLPMTLGGLGRAFISTLQIREPSQRGTSPGYFHLHTWGPPSCPAGHKLAHGLLHKCPLWAGCLGKRKGPELTLLCPACLSRSLSVCLSFLGLSFAGETWQLCNWGLLEAEAGPDLGCFLPVSVSHLGQGSDRDEPKHTQFRIIGSGLGGRP